VKLLLELNVLSRKAMMFLLLQVMVMLFLVLSMMNNLHHPLLLDQTRELKLVIMRLIHWLGNLHLYIIGLPQL
jgi:hypothetical protein